MTAIAPAQRLTGPTCPPGNAPARLTDRERDVLRLLAEGRSNAGISRSLYLSPKTVERHVGSVFLKLGLAEESSSNRRVLATLSWVRWTASRV